MRPPALPIPPLDYSKGFFDTLLSILMKYFTQSTAELEYSLNRSVPTEISQNTRMGDDEHSFIAVVSGLTMTLPLASAERYGRDWTVLLGTIGWVDVTVSGDDVLILPVVDDTIRLTVKGSSVTLRCVSSNSWGIA